MRVHRHPPCIFLKWWQHISNIQCIYMYLKMYDLLMFTCIGYKLPTFWEYMSIGEDSVQG